MQTLSINHAKALVQHVCFELHEPVMLWGAPGVGKSALAAQLADENSAQLVDIRLSQYDSVDLRGIPVADPASSLTVWHAPATLPFVGNSAFSDTNPVLLFLDEINAASPAVAAVAYQLINDRGVGEHKLKDNVVVLAAGNREGDRGVVNRMPLPLANRFTHVEVDCDVDSWCVWAQSQGLPAEGLAFLQFRKPLISTFDPSKPTKAFATPRTWAKALKYFASNMPAHIKQAAMSGAVGEGNAAEFWGFVDVWKSIAGIVPKVLAAPKTAPLMEEPSMQYAVTIALSGEMSVQTVGAIHLYLQRMSPEFLVLAWQLAIKRDVKLIQAPEFLDLSKKYRAVFQS